MDAAAAMMDSGKPVPTIIRSKFVGSTGGNSVAGDDEVSESDIDGWREKFG